MRVDVPTSQSILRLWEEVAEATHAYDAIAPQFLVDHVVGRGRPGHDRADEHPGGPGPNLQTVRRRGWYTVERAASVVSRMR